MPFFDFRIEQTAPDRWVTGCEVSFPFSRHIQPFFATFAEAQAAQKEFYESYQPAPAPEPEPEPAAKKAQPAPRPVAPAAVPVQAAKPAEAAPVAAPASDAPAAPSDAAKAP